MEEGTSFQKYLRDRLSTETHNKKVGQVNCKKC